MNIHFLQLDYIGLWTYIFDYICWMFTILLILVEK